jgi:formate--tetrahydrofolate ligase
VLSDVEIAQSARLRLVREVAEDLGLGPDLLEPYGRYKTKVSLKARAAFADRPNGRYVVVTAMTPTPLGEGKTLTTIGLGQALARSGRTAFSLRHQGRCGGRRVLPGPADGGHEPASDW